MSEWKSNHGVSDQGAFNAGVYGKPSSTYDIARAQEETRKHQQPSYQSPSYQPPSYQPHIPGSDGVYWPGVKFIGVLVLIGLIIFVISTADYWEREIKNTLLNAEASTVKSLDVTHYEKLSPEATKLSAQPTSKLYASAFPKQSVGGVVGIGLTDKQELAIAAAWLRYARDPISFDKLPEKNRRFIIYTFDIYLTSLIDGGDANAKRDFTELYNRELNRR